MLFNEEVSVAVGGKTLIKSSHISLQQGFKYAIVGENGVGKTTLLNHIFSKVRNKFDTLYISQTDNFTIKDCNKDTTVYDYMILSNNKLYELYTNVTKLEQNIKTDDQMKLYNAYMEELTALNFDRYKANIHKILHGLGFENTDMKVSLLSGGNQSKLSLGRALLLEPQLLLLDEPTNHLDLHNILWLEKYLSEYKNTLILISHNINFFDSIVDHVLYFFNVDPENPSVVTVKGGYANFMKSYKQKKSAYHDEYDKFSKRVAELKNSNDKNALDKFVKTKNINRPLKDANIEISFSDVGSLTHDEYSNIISFEKVGFSYDSKEILKNVDIGISATTRYVLIGNNGAGKTTFFNLCIGQLKPTYGEIKRNDGLRIGYFSQHTINELPLDMNPIEYLQMIDQKIKHSDCRSILAKIGFKKMHKDDTFDVGKMKIGDMSGGQKVKLAFCGIQVRRPHLILFDEPTNHLDIFSIDEFIKAINKFNGGIVIITHDQYVIDGIENYKLVTLKDGHMNEYNGTFEDYCADQ